MEMSSKFEFASMGLINTGGWAEYYDPTAEEPCGGGSFTWTAAMVMEYLGLDECFLPFRIGR